MYNAKRESLWEFNIAVFFLCSIVIDVAPQLFQQQRRMYTSDVSDYKDLPFYSCEISGHKPVAWSGE